MFTQRLALRRYTKDKLCFKLLFSRIVKISTFAYFVPKFIFFVFVRKANFLVYITSLHTSYANVYKRILVHIVVWIIGRENSIEIQNIY